MVKKTTNKKKKKEYSNSISNSFGKIKMMVKDSDKFFKSVEKQDLIGVLRFFVLFYLIFFILSIISNLIVTLFIYTEKTAFKEIARIILLNFIEFVITSLMAVFLVSFIIYLALAILKVKKGYNNSFKSIAYAMILMKVYLIAILVISPILQLILPFDSTSLAVMQTSQDPEVIRNALNEFISQTNAMINIIVSIVIYLIAAIHSIIFAIKGIARFNGISNKKSVLSILLGIVIGVIILVILGLIVAFTSNGPAVA